MNPRPTSNRVRTTGFATIAVLSVLLLVGVGVAATTHQLHRDVQRTRLEKAHAQLRQLLTAGAQAAPYTAELINPNTGQPLKTWTMILPNEIDPPPESRDATTSSAVSLKTQTSAGGLIRSVTVTARHKGLTATQTLRYGKIPEGWGLLEIRSDPLPRPPTMPKPPRG
ncbi:MAG: hypothetical protein ACYTGQ_16035 [Planctomycetota bacterium]|jgi:hypothetical protein